MRKIFCTILIVLALCLPSGAAWAFNGGNGTVSNPFIVTTPAHLDAVRNHLSAHFRLGNDINLTTYLSIGNPGFNGGAGWNPIGTTGAPFTGNFDGDGHSITGLWINRPTADNVGLFGVTENATIRNIGVEISGAGVDEIRGRSMLGALVGNKTGGSIINSHSTGRVTVLSNTGSNIGGLVGQMSGGSISNSRSSADVATTDNWHSGSNIGGLVGNLINSGTISNSHATGSVGSRQNVGGLVGRLDSSSITTSHATGDVTLTGTAASTGGFGGLVGLMNAPWGGGNNSSITSSYATGNVQGHANTGGLVGSVSGSSSNTSTIASSYATGNVTGGNHVGGDGAGGLVGTLGGASSIVNSYATGNVNGRTAGGLAGWSFGSISNSFATGNATGSLDAGGLIGVASASNITNSFATGNVTGNLQARALIGHGNFTAANNHRYIGVLVNGAAIAWNAPQSTHDGMHGGVITATQLITRATFETLVTNWQFHPAGPWHWDAGGFPKLNLGTEVFPFGPNVNVHIPVTGITKTSASAVQAGTPLTLTGTAAPSNATNQVIAWSVLNAGTTGATVTGSTLNTTAAGTATVRATIVNGIAPGSNFTQDFTITVSAAPIVAPQITQHPQSQTVVAGNSVTFSAAATGTAPLSWQWERSNNNGVTWSNVGTNSNTFSFTAQTADHNARFRVRVSNAYSATSNQATLTIATAPQITTHPQSQTIAAGSPVTFSATATGTAPLSWQWQRSNNNGVTWSNVGGNSSTFAFITQVADNNARFRVIVTNAHGNATSNQATLTVVTAPQITQHPTILPTPPVTPGTQVTISATATGTAPLTWQWQRSNDNGSTWNNVGTNASTLSFTAQLADNNARFRVVVTNAHGNATSNQVTLTVATAPQITTHPQNQSVTAGSVVSFNAAATGATPLTWQWQRSNDNGNTWNNIGTNSSTFSLTALLTDNNARFRVVVTNAHGNATSNQATLTVTPVITAPQITAHPQPQTVIAGSTATFSATATGTAPLAWQWQRLDDNGSTWSNVGTDSNTFSFTAQTADNNAVFRVVVSNAHPSNATSNQATLTVNANAFSGGDGTAPNPFIITTPAQLDAVRNHLSAHFRLGNDINLTAYLASGGAGHAQWGAEGWLPIGTGWPTNTPFSGNFDGDGHKITGLWIDRPSTSCVGLFGYVNNATIKNLGLEISYDGLRGGDWVGGLVGRQQDGNIKNCYTTGNVRGNLNVGGLVGRNLGRIENSYTTGNVSSSFGNTGGLVGVQASGSSIKNSYAIGNVASNGGVNVGGLVGQSFGSIENSYATGSVNGFMGAGGLVGSHSNSSITNSYATGSVSGTGAGGLVGSQNNSSIINSFASGNVTGTHTTGGLVGQQSGINTITNSYRYQFMTVNGVVRTENTPNDRHGGIVTAVQLMTRATFEDNGWLFNDSTPTAGPWHWDAAGFPKLNIGTESSPFRFPVITTSTLPAVTVGAAYNQTLSATGSPITWSITSGNLPGGLTLNATTGVISGTPTAHGTFNFTARATNTNTTGINERALSIVVNSNITGITLLPVGVSVARGRTRTFTATVTGVNNPPQTVTWTLEGASPGTSISSTGVLTVAGNETASSFTVRARSTINTAISTTSTVWPTSDSGNGATIGGQEIGLAVDSSGLNWHWNATDRVLTLHNGPNFGDISFDADDVTIHVAGNNVHAESISNNAWPNGNITITGDAWSTLNLQSNNQPAISTGWGGNIVINSGVVNATTSAPNNPAIVAGGSVIITGTADVTASTFNGNGSAIVASDAITISGNANVTANTNTGSSLFSFSQNINITGGTTSLNFNAGGVAFGGAEPIISGNNTKVYVNGEQLYPETDAGTGNNNGGDDNYGGEGGGGNNDGNYTPDTTPPGGGPNTDGGGCNITAGLFAMLLVLPLFFRRKK